MKAGKLMLDLNKRFKATSAKSGTIKGYRSESGELFFRRECDTIQCFGEPDTAEFADLRDYLKNVVIGVQVLDDDSGFIEVWAEK